MQISTPIKVDLNNPLPLPVVKAKQGDSGRSVRATLYNNGVVITPDIAPRVYIKKPDGTKVFNACTIDGDVVTIPLTTQTLAVSGDAEVELLFVRDGQAVSTPIFKLFILPTNIDDSAIESTDEFTALIEALAAVGNIVPRSEIENTYATKSEVVPREEIEGEYAKKSETIQSHGGTLDDGARINYASSITRGQAPSSRYDNDVIRFVDKDDQFVNGIKFAYGTNNRNSIEFIARGTDSTGNATYAEMGVEVGYDGTKKGYAPTPANSSNSTEIVTAEWARENVASKGAIRWIGQSGATGIVTFPANSINLLIIQSASSGCNGIILVYGGTQQVFYEVLTPDTLSKISLSKSGYVVTVKNNDTANATRICYLNILGGIPS